MQPGFDDSTWRQAETVIVFSADWSMPELRHVPFMDEGPVRPAAVLETGEPLELDDTLAITHVRMGDALCFKDWDWAGAEREFQRALELDPDSAEASCRYGVFLWARLRNADALVQLQKSVELDPFSLDANWLLGWVFFSLHQLDEAEEEARKMLAMDANLWLGYHIRAVSRTLKGLWAEALEDSERTAAIEGGPASLGSLCWCYARVGRLEAARRTLERLEQMTPKRIVPPTWLALAYDALGAGAQARACICLVMTGSITGSTPAGVLTTLPNALVTTKV